MNAKNMKEEVKLSAWQRFTNFWREVVEELKKVDWTSREKLWSATKIVIVSSLVMSAYLFALDALFSWLLKFAK